MTWNVTATKPAFSVTYLSQTPEIALAQVRRFELTNWPSITVTAPDGSSLTVAELEAVIAAAGDDAEQPSAVLQQRSEMSAD